MITEHTVVYDVAYPLGRGKKIMEVSTRLIKKGYEIDWICFKTWSGDEF